jgi:hypothetical protein
MTIRVFVAKGSHPSGRIEPTAGYPPMVVTLDAKRRPTVSGSPRTGQAWRLLRCALRRRRGRDRLPSPGRTRELAGGDVYRAKDTKLRRDVALKVPPDAVATDPERLARLHREAQVLEILRTHCESCSFSRVRCGTEIPRFCNATTGNRNGWLPGSSSCFRVCLALVQCWRIGCWFISGRSNVSLRPTKPS